MIDFPPETGERLDIIVAIIFVVIEKTVNGFAKGKALGFTMALPMALLRYGFTAR